MSKDILYYGEQLVFETRRIDQDFPADSDYLEQLYRVLDAVTVLEFYVQDEIYRLEQTIDGATYDPGSSKQPFDYGNTPF